ncbi:MULTISPECIES: DEAD/DEAH box helicase [unclassified Wenzhouxiangella]|uniref:DEAD/DEAH box helicase n=1 Tax=unclassified Wenzhouxiangella TaxID=2613841 RepID=UPI000E32CAB4|nr:MULTISPECIES: DEAD/DEAH box helicase [unclassified Wenzhouxiangella]RFF27683.1 DEAD/DEAH box helicase [Wenzhouxiangella sp. 15181]RFP69775.1 DEAD/DEAH box helicase [Wenzhouxiangella sp. 15190]
MSLFDAQQALDAWFANSVGEPTAVQRSAWPVLREGRNALVIASTGQGKSLAAWRPLVEGLVSRPGRGVRALHIAPLKALARDMTHNLAPLLGAVVPVSGHAPRIGLRCGDTPRAERDRQRRNPPEILSTTPESLFVLLGSRGGRALLRTVESVVVDELHSLAGNKRGAHLALSLARLDRLAGRPVQRVGLSATAHPAEIQARFLAGSAECEIVAPDAPGPVKLEVELPGMPLGPYPNSVHWEQIHARIAELAAADRSLLVFCQTRARVERTAATLDELLEAAGQPKQVGAHHGSLDTAHREAIEARFKAGELRVLVSSASLELGLDLGHVDRVCQIGVPGSANLVRQRAGRSGHRPGRRPCMHLFPLTLNQLVETRALADVIADGGVDAVEPLEAPFDVLAQQLVALVANGVGKVDELLAVVRSAWPYRGIGKADLESLLASLADRPGLMPDEQLDPLLIADERGGYRAHAEADRLVLTNAGTIPEWFEYEVVRADTGDVVGRLDEEVAFESSPGQVLQLGNRPWRILRVLTGLVRVEPAEEEPAELPFWFGEGPGRSSEMAQAMLRVIAGQGRSPPHPQALTLLDESRVLLGALPAPDRMVIEQFSDPGGDRHIVLHTFAGARINRAWGLALRKRFCRQFNFELQAAATDDGVLISLGVTSQFDLAAVAGFVKSHNVADVLTQAMLDTPLFVTRFRWCANNALVLLKNGPNGPLPSQRQRSQAENLIACVFPDQLACLENLSGAREVPDHPLVQQALSDCLDDYMDLGGLQCLLARIETGEIAVHAVETSRPSPLAEALIHAPRHSYLDEDDAEERRTRNFERPAARPGGATRSRSGPRPPAGSGGNTSKPPARGPGVAPAVASAGELASRTPSTTALERLLEQAGFMTQREGESGLGLAQPVPAGGWTRWFSKLVREGRALALVNPENGQRLWIATCRLDWFLSLDGRWQPHPPPGAFPQDALPSDRGAVWQWLVEARRKVEGEAAFETIAALFELTGAREVGHRASKIA